MYMYQGQVGAFFECPDARSCCGLMHTTSSTYLRVPFPHPSARCVKHSTQLCSCQLPAGSICFSLRTVRETWNTPALIPSYNLSHVTSFSHYLCTLQREDLFFFYPCQKEYCPSSLTWWHQLRGILLVNYCGWYFTGLWESRSTGNCSKCCLYK